MTTQQRFFNRPRLWGLLCGLALAVAQFLALAGFAPTGGGTAQAATQTCTPNGAVLDCTVTFDFIGAPESWTVPTGVTQATFDLYGAQGEHSIGGRGGRVTALLPVIPGASYQIRVGGAGRLIDRGGFNGGGTGARNGGGGGGAADVRTGTFTLADRLLIAAGGGGAGGGGAGNSFVGPGGAGGYPNGGNGTADGERAFGGGGGTQTAGGAGGTGSVAGSAGSLGQGGASANGWYGGGGGGGYYGGGGGGIYFVVNGGGGGGGSSYGPAGATFETGVRTGNGLVTISYTLLDTSAPVANPTQAPAANVAGWNNTNVIVTWNWTDPSTDSGYASGLDPANCTTSSSGGEGSLTLTAPCNDVAGNQGTATYPVKVDKTAPVVTVTGVSDGSTYTLGSVPISGCSTSDALSGVATPAAFSRSGGNPDGTGSFTITCSGAVDNAGNSAASVSVSYSVILPPDNTPPDTTIDSQPANPSSSSASFTFSGSDDVTPAASLTFECNLDNAAFAACTSPRNYSGLADGSHTFQVRAMDAAGNVDPTPASYTWTINTAPPPQTLYQQIQAVRTTLAALLPSGNSKTDKSLTKALGKLDQALADNLWQPDGNHLTLIGDDVFNRLYDAVKELGKIKNPSTGSGQAPAPTVRSALTTLTGISRTLAQTALDEAIADHGDPNKIRKAQSKLSKGDGEAAKGKLDKAIAQYEDAWEYAQQALGLPVASSLPAEELPATSDEESNEPAAEEREAVAGETQRIFLPQINR